MVVVGIAAAAIVSAAICIDEGEVVVLFTTDANEKVHDTQLWTVELEGIRYLRASGADVAWLARLRERPLVEIEFEASSSHFHAVPQDDANLRGRLNAAMARKYGFADRVWSK